MLGPSAFCLLDGILGLGVSLFFLALRLQDDTNMGRVGLSVAIDLLIYGSLSLLGILVLADRSHRRRLWFAFLRCAIVAAAMVIPAAVLFGPSGGFHHHIGFGIPFMYMIWNGVDAAEGSFQIIEGYEVWFDSLRFGVLLAIWVGLLVVAVRFIHPTRISEQPIIERTD